MVGRAPRHADRPRRRPPDVARPGVLPAAPAHHVVRGGVGVPVGQPRRRGRRRAHRAGRVRCRRCSNACRSPCTACRCSPSGRSCRSSPPARRRRSCWRPSRCSSRRWCAACSGCGRPTRRASTSSTPPAGASCGCSRRCGSRRRCRRCSSGCASPRRPRCSGAIVGEYLGGSRGLGVAMILSQSSFQVARTWGLAVVIGVTVGLAYAVTGLIARFLAAVGGGRAADHRAAARPVPARRRRHGAHRRGVGGDPRVRVVGDAALVRPEPVLRQAAARRVAVPHDRQRRPQRGVVGARHDARRHGGRLRHRVGRLGGGGRRRSSPRRSSMPW